MTHGYSFTPSTNLQVTAVRCYSSDKVSIWTDSGTLLASQAVSSCGSWTEAALAAPVTLSAGTTYRVTAHYSGDTTGYYPDGPGQLPLPTARSGRTSTLPSAILSHYSVGAKPGAAG